MGGCVLLEMTGFDERFAAGSVQVEHECGRTRGRIVVSAGVDGAWDILVARAADAYHGLAFGGSGLPVGA